MTRKKSVNYHRQAAALCTDGVVATIHLDPKRLTPRIRNGAKRMLASGAITGGYQSQTAKVATLVSDVFGLGLRRGNDLKVSGNDTELREEIAKVREADLAAWLLGEGAQPTRYGASYHQQRLKLAKDRAANEARALRSRACPPVTVNFIDGKFKLQAARLILEANGGFSARVAQAVEAIDRGEPIPLNHLNG